MMKKLVLGLFVLTLGIALTACNPQSVSTFTDADDVYAFQAVSATELLAGAQESISLTALPLSVSAFSNPQLSLLDEPTTTEGEEPIGTEEINVLDQYLTMMEQFLGNDNGLAVTVVESDLVDYAVKIIYTTRNLLGEDIVYTLYYNEVLFEDLTAVDDDVITTDEETTTTEPLAYGDQNHDCVFDDEGDNEINYLLSGILIVGETTYNLEGKKITDGTEEIMILRSYIDHDNYVKVIYQIDSEDNDQKFFYEVVTDGVIINRSKVKVETEDNKIKTRLEFIEGTASGKYVFTQETEDNVTYIKIKYEIENNDIVETGMIHITATYDEVTGITTYDYNVKPDGQKAYSHQKGHVNQYGNHTQNQQSHSGNNN
ncbi:MAG: hypothetical protein PHC32_03615 [Candidatus Izemoplasmatales bacterium]|nr:hypothetical protein [Candidatus Izemoplasmatales bacterium]